MFYHDGKLQYPVRVETPSPFFARMLQQAIGGVEGEIRVALQYLFQSWGSRGPAKYRDMLLETGTEELAHIEMLATAVALNLEKSSPEEQIAAAQRNPLVGAIMGGCDPRQFLSTGLAALASDANGVPFDGSHVYASGNIAADMYANVTAEATGRALAVRLYNLTDDPGMKDMLQFLIARDTMHQQQWLAVLEELGGPEVNLPIPNSHPENEQIQEFAYAFVGTAKDGELKSVGRWTQGASLDGKGQFQGIPASPLGEKPVLAPPMPNGGAQFGQTRAGMEAQGLDPTAARAADASARMPVGESPASNPAPMPPTAVVSGAGAAGGSQGLSGSDLGSSGLETGAALNSGMNADAPSDLGAQGTDTGANAGVNSDAGERLGDPNLRSGNPSGL